MICYLYSAIVDVGVRYYVARKSGAKITIFNVRTPFDVKLYIVEAEMSKFACSAYYPYLCRVFHHK